MDSHRLIEQFKDQKPRDAGPRNKNYMAKLFQEARVNPHPYPGWQILVVTDLLMVREHQSGVVQIFISKKLLR